MMSSQTAFDLRCEWGAAGIAQLAPSSDVIVIVDVLSFSTCVDVAVARGAMVYPYRWKGVAAEAYAAKVGATLAGDRASGGYSLSPASLCAIPAGTRLMLPSPNGATLSLATGATPTFAGCLRNARAVAQAAQRVGSRISIIPAGERWPDGSLRPAAEDWLGAGAIIAHLMGTRSPEAELAYQVFVLAQMRLRWYLERCASGQELIARGFAEDVALAAALDQSMCAPILRAGTYQTA